MFKLIRVFLIINLIAFSVSSCRHYKVSGTKVISEFKHITLPYFNVIGEEFIFNAKIDVYGNQLSGILVIKKMDDHRKRLALLSEFGNTLLDFEFINNEINVIYIMDDLDRKIIVSKLKKYFQLLVHSEYKVKKQFETEDGHKIVSKLQGNRIFLNFDEKGSFTDLKEVSRIRSKAEIQFYGNENQIDSIEFKSLKLPIHMMLKIRYAQ